MDYEKYITERKFVEVATVVLPKAEFAKVSTAMIADGWECTGSEASGNRKLCSCIMQRPVVRPIKW